MQVNEKQLRRTNEEMLRINKFHGFRKFSGVREVQRFSWLLHACIPLNPWTINGTEMEPRLIVNVIRCISLPINQYTTTVWFIIAMTCEYILSKYDLFNFGKHPTISVFMFLLFLRSPITYVRSWGTFHTFNRPNEIWKIWWKCWVLTVLKFWLP